MSLYLRIVLIIVSFVYFIFIVRNIRKSKVKLDNTFFWIAFSFFILILSLFPKIADYGANLVGMISSVNFVLLFIIFLLLYKMFTLTVQFSRLQQKFEELVQNIALKNKEEESSQIEDSLYDKK